MPWFKVGGVPANKIPRPKYDASTHEFCTHCKQIKLHSEFPKNKNTRTGLHSWCKLCNNASAEHPKGTVAYRRRRDAQAMYARIRSIRDGKHTPEYLRVPVLAVRPAKLKERLAMLGESTDRDRIGQAAQAWQGYKRRREQQSG